MRKITAGKTLTGNGTEYIVAIRNDDGTTHTELLREAVTEECIHPATVDSVARVAFVNKVLAEHSQEPMTEEEVKFFNSPRFIESGM